ncbi:hypothetical protein O6H91_07G100900 [Diphasiastrum complanatum]|uniref:Uncharacterized protein n=1 Tax=Diphasiastrum complanatum TaxID=34168 RepID=A0ACC2D804_DIPCM|nr:hypothetical protein O6H91_07G100900 [Diphasiastrum complanatum]
MATVQFCHDNTFVTAIGILRVKPGHTHDETLETINAHYGALDEADEFTIAAILRSLDHAYAGGYAQFKKGTHVPTVLQLPHFVPIMEAVKAVSDVEVINVEAILGVSKTGEVPKLSKGDILHMGLLSTEPESQQSLIETLQKTLKQRVESEDGLRSVTLHRSLDGNKVVVIGVWTDAASAQAATISTGWQQAEESLGHLVKCKEFIFFEVVLVR